MAGSSNISLDFRMDPENVARNTVSDFFNSIGYLRHSLAPP
jgi:hypothetical protein